MENTEEGLAASKVVRDVAKRMREEFEASSAPEAPLASKKAPVAQKTCTHHIEVPTDFDAAAHDAAFDPQLHGTCACAQWTRESSGSSASRACRLWPCGGVAAGWVPGRQRWHAGRRLLWRHACCGGCRQPGGAEVHGHHGQAVPVHSGPLPVDGRGLPGARQAVTQQAARRAACPDHSTVLVLAFTPPAAGAIVPA